MSHVRRVVSVSALVVAGSATLLAWRRGTLGRAVANLRAYSAPSIATYDSAAARFLAGFYDRVARETADLRPSGKLLDVGSGPGRLDIVVARAFPKLQVVGVDVSTEMVERARKAARQSNLGDQLSFQQGDAGALPFPDASVDVVLSTLSMHHWPDPSRGLAEIHRVLKPGGVARIYDVVEWMRRLEHSGAGMADLAASSPFRGGQVETVVRFGPVPVFQRAQLRKSGDSD